MPTAFVTGATGFIGANLVRCLLHHGWKVRALVRPTSDLANLKGLNVEIVRGDIREYHRMLFGMVGTDAVFHTAAQYELWARDPRALFDTNVKGTANVMRAALQAKVRKVVHTSSTATVTRRKDGKPGTEKDYAIARELPGAYERSKIESERQVLAMVKEQGLPAVVVNPTAPVGPFDVKPTPTGKMILDLLNGRMLAYLDGGINIVDVEDVAEAHLAAFEKGKVGERYILGNRNMSLKELFELVCRQAERKPPSISVPYWVAYSAGVVSEGVISRITGKPPMVPLNGVRLARDKMFFDSSKAVAELGMPQTPVEEAVRKAMTWFRANGYLK